VKRPWWQWILIVLLWLAIIALAVDFMLQEHRYPTANPWNGPIDYPARQELEG
jgi:hypothetical protein